MGAFWEPEAEVDIARRRRRRGPLPEKRKKTGRDEEQGTVGGRAQARDRMLTLHLKADVAKLWAHALRGISGPRVLT